VANDVHVLLISGSLRRSSTNSAVLRTAIELAPAGVVATQYGAMDRLPHFNPDHDGPELHPEVVELRRSIHRADALLLSTPEYAGALPGSFKNVLDWTIGDDEAGSIYNKPVAWINASPRQARLAHDSLRVVLEYAHAQIVESACAHVAVTSANLGPDGLVGDPGLQDVIGQSLARLVEHSRQQLVAMSATT